MRQTLERALRGVIGKGIATTALAVAVAGHAVAQPALRDQVEMLDWSDPERAAQLLDATTAPPEARVMSVFI